ncbi:hypothetical protein MKC77_21490, partial [[Clostridium] innocuum]|nr:hypothetical protein [[Clostridium] innocuum]
KNRYTTSFTHDITINGLWFTTLGGNYLWLACLQLNLCHARHTIIINQWTSIDLLTTSLSYTLSFNLKKNNKIISV